MPLPEVFKDLKLDVWYRAVVYIGGVVLIFSFFVEVRGITNIQLQLLAGGFFLIGLGEWKNHIRKSMITPSNVYTGSSAFVTGIIRQPNIIGVLIEIIGLSLIVGFVWSLS